MKIGIIEPDELLSDLLSFRLELLGHEVVTWGCGSDAIAQMEEANLDVLVVDTYLPDMQGWEALQRIRKSYTGQELPILTLSVDPDLSLVEQSVRAGANDYLITPFDPTVLQGKIDALLIFKQKANTLR